jgi:hypothetical protein
MVLLIRETISVNVMPATMACGRRTQARCGPLISKIAPTARRQFPLAGTPILMAADLGAIASRNSGPVDVIHGHSARASTQL